MTLDNTEFLRRFCLHILPAGFVKIRHYGILSSRRKAEYIPGLKDQNGKTVQREKPSWKQVCRERMGFDPEKCPCCGDGKMVLLQVIKPRPPPDLPLPDLEYLQTNHYPCLSGTAFGMPGLAGNTSKPTEVK